jgi:preprotein translocase subunit SecB
LFPYGREAIDALVTKGSFPALMLAPINFEAVYMQAKRQQATEQQVPVS